MQSILPLAPLPTLQAGDDDVVLRALVVGVRRLKAITFLRLRLPHGFVQAVCTKPLPDGVREHASVEVRGTLVPAALKDPALTHPHLELQVTELELLASPGAPPPFDVSKRTLDAGPEARLDHRPLALRHPTLAATFRVQHVILQAFRAHLNAAAFTELQTPKLVSTGAEGGADVFVLDYFGRRATLAQSPQFHKEFGTGAFLRVYEVGPVFRAEKHATSRHLNQYTSLDVELGPIRDVTEVMALQTGLLREICATVQEACGRELALLGAEVPEVASIPAVPFDEARALIGAGPGDDLAPADEAAIGALVKAETGSDFVFVTHYPSTKRPFYAMDDPADPTRTVSFDLLFRGVEITTGGQRIHEAEALVAKLRARGLDPDAFAFFHQVHAYGLPPHGGFGMGLERLTQHLLGLAQIKDATLFPRDRNRLAP